MPQRYRGVVFSGMPCAGWAVSLPALRASRRRNKRWPTYPLTPLDRQAPSRQHFYGTRSRPDARHRVAGAPRSFVVDVDRAHPDSSAGLRLEALADRQHRRIHLGTTCRVPAGTARVRADRVWMQPVPGTRGRFRACTRPVPPSLPCRNYDEDKVTDLMPPAAGTCL